ARSSSPLKEGHGCAWTPRGVTKVEMVALWIVEVDGLLDEPQSQNLCVKVNRTLSVGADERDVVQSMNTHMRLLAGDAPFNAKSTMAKPRRTQRRHPARQCCLSIRGHGRRLGLAPMRRSPLWCPIASTRCSVPALRHPSRLPAP